MVFFKRLSTGVFGKPLETKSSSSITIIFLTWVLSIISASTLVDGENIIIVFTCASFNWCCNSLEVYKGLTLTCTPPTFIMPHIATGKLNIFGDISAT